MMVSKREEIRPWGQYKILYQNPMYKVKEIIVLPKQKLSLQYHMRRNELWQIIKGEGIVTIGNYGYTAMEGMIFTILKEEKHRIENTGDEPLLFVEIQTGEYFGEDDIVRIEDDYGRK
jgi:mannose-6-phosphate isomerase